jgi:hypothetical protein
MGKGIKIPASLILNAPICSDSFVRADGALGSTDGLGHAEANGGSGKVWVYDAGVWVVSGNKAVGTPTATEKLTDGGLENWDSATNLTSWTEGKEGTSSINREDTVKHGGTYSVRFDIDALGNYAAISQAPAVGAGVWAMMTGWFYAAASKFISFHRDLTNLNPVAPGTTWTQYRVVVRNTSANPTWGIKRAYGSDTSFSCYGDDLSLATLTLSSLFTNIDAGRADTFRWQQINTLVARTQGGLAVRLDNPAAPANFIIAYMDGTNVKIDECVAGAYAALGTAAKGFTADDWLGLHVMGNAWRLYHRTDAGVVTLIASGTTNVLTGNYVSIFNTYGGNKFGNFEDWPTGSLGEFESLNQL